MVSPGIAPMGVLATFPAVASPVLVLESYPVAICRATSHGTSQMIFHRVSPGVPHLANVHGVSHEAPRVSYHGAVNLLASFHASPVSPSPAPVPSPVALSPVASSPVEFSPVVPSPSPSLGVPFLWLPSLYLAALFLGVLSVVVVLPPGNARVFFH